MKKALLILCGLSSAAIAQSKPTLKAGDYAKWETLGNSAISPDGKWLAYDIRRVDASTELRFHALGSDQERIAKSANGAQFSADSRWLVYTITPDTIGRGGRGAARGGGGGRGGAAPDANPTASHNKLAIVDLRATGDSATSTLEDVQSFSLNEPGTFVALRRYPATGRRSADVLVRDLGQGTELTFGNVSEMAWSDDGALLAMAIDVDSKNGNGVQLFDTKSGTIRSLDASDSRYTGLAWRLHSQDLAVFRSRTDSAFVDTSYTVLAFRNAGAAPSKVTYDFASDAEFNKDMRVASYRRFEWSDDGKLLYFGTAAREPKPLASDRRAPGELPPARVQVWHYKDMREFHQQEVNAAQDRQRTLLVAWQIGAPHARTLTTDLNETVQFSEDRSTVLVSDAAPYTREAMSGRAARDVYRVDPLTGKRDKILTKTAFGASLSPTGKHALYQQGGDWWSLDFATGAKGNVTGPAKGVFVDMEDDHPAERRAYGLAGFTTGENGAIVYDRFDLWAVNLDGSKPTRLTNGRADSTVYRCVSEAGGGFGRGGGAGAARGPAPCQLEGESRTIDTNKPLIVSATGEYNKKSGYARVADGRVSSLVWDDRMITRLTKAKSAGTYVFEQQTYEASPQLYTASIALSEAKQASHVNAFQNDYAWGKQVLMPYTNKRGDKLQMMLIYPANYQPGKKYPMVVYYYEKLSQGFHQFVTPSDRNPYNVTVFSQNGYFVLRPDIVFQKRNPGYSGLDCVTSAVATIEARVPDIEVKQVGNFGHSWGGYQSAFYAAHNHGTFAATIAGAPLTDLISMYGYTSGNSGLPETGHYETSQERMEVPLWEDPQAYIRNSTVYSLDSLHTPLLLEEGDADGNVNPFQSQEVYNFGRRLGKNVVYLVYEGENHNVARAESQHDYLERQLQWFGHWLKGEPAAAWITDGETYADRQKILRGGGAPTGGGPVQAGAVGRGAP